MLLYSPLWNSRMTLNGSLGRFGSILYYRDTVLGAFPKGSTERLREDFLINTTESSDSVKRRALPNSLKRFVPGSTANCSTVRSFPLLSKDVPSNGRYATNPLVTNAGCPSAERLKSSPTSRLNTVMGRQRLGLVDRGFIDGLEWLGAGDCWPFGNWSRSKVPRKLGLWPLQGKRCKKWGICAEMEDLPVDSAR